MGKLACNKHGWCFWLYNFCPALTEKIWNSFIDTYSGEKSRILFSYSFFCLKSFSFPFFSFFPLIPISILFSVSMFSLFSFLFLWLVAISLIKPLSVPFLTFSSLTKEYLHISSRTHAYSIATTPSYITLSLFLPLSISLSSYVDHDEDPVRE